MMDFLAYSEIALPEYNFLDGSVNQVLLAFLLLAIISALRKRGRIFFLEQEKDLLLNTIHQTIHSLKNSQNIQQELVADNLPPLASVKVRRLETQILEILNINKSALSVSRGEADDDSPTGKYELYTYITSLVSSFREHAEDCRVKLNVFTDAGYRVCNIHEMAFTAAVQSLLKRVIDSTRPDGSVNVILSCRDERWSMELSNYSPERDYRKYFGLFLTSMRICFGDNLRFIRHIVKSHGGEISGYECGKWVRYKITAPLGSDNLPASPVEILTHAGRQPHIVLIMEDRKLSGYLKAALSPFYRVSVYEHYRQITIPLSNDNTDIIIIDAESEDSELCSRIKKNKHTSDVSILLLTPSLGVEALKEFETWRADRFLPRIVPVERLKEEIYSILKERRQQLERVVRLVNTDFAAGFPDDLMLSERDAEIMRKLNGLLEEHLDEKWDKATLALALAMGNTKFFNTVRRITKVNVSRYVFFFKMEKAKGLLLTGEYTVVEVAHRVGEDNGQSLGKKFKRYCNLTPTQFMKKHGL